MMPEFVKYNDMFEHPRLYLQQMVKDAFPEMDISLEKMSDDECRFLLETVLKRAKEY